MDANETRTQELARQTKKFAKAKAAGDDRRRDAALAKLRKDLAADVADLG